MRVLQFGERVFDRGLLIGRQLVAEFLQLFLRLEDEAVGLVDLVDLFAGGLIGGFIGPCFGLHLFHFFLAETAAGFDADLLFFASTLVLGRYVQDAIGI